MAEASYAKVTKLNKDNYPTWRFVVEQVLRSKGYWNRVQPADNEAYAAAEAQEQKAMTEIVTTLEEDMVRTIIDCVSARDVWTTLRDYAENNSAESADLIDHQMRSTKYRDGASMRGHLERLKHFKRRLTQAGQNIGDAGLITVILIAFHWHGRLRRMF